MSNIKKIFVCIGFFIVLMLIENKSNATTISVTPENPKVGDEIIITVTVPNVHTSSVTANITGVVSGTVKVVGGDMAGEAKTYSNSAKFTCNKSGSINVEISSDSSAVLSGQYVNVAAQKTITVSDNSSSNGNSNTSTSPETTTPEKKSTEARLSNFGIKPNEYDFSGFSKNTNKEDWSVEVPNNATEVEVYATPKDKNAKVTGTGKVSLKEGNNTVRVTVTAEAGNTKTYTLTIKRRTAEEDAVTAEKSSNADLKSLGIKPEEYDFSGFQKDITEYVANVPSDVDEIEVYAEASDSKAQVNGIGKISLKEGKNEIKIEVVAEDGTAKTYTIEVTRGESNTNTTSKFGLSKLTISGFTLNPNFNVGTYEYTVELNEDLTSLDIEAIATDENVNIEIVGNENLQEGENLITILVSNKDTNEVATYQITVNKNLSLEPQKMSWLKPSTWGKEEIIKLIIISVLVILIISSVILKIKISREKENDEDLEFPGADELDKAMAEHQELSDYSEDVTSEYNLDEENNKEENEIITDSLKTETNSNYLEEIAKNNGIEFTDYNNNKNKRKGKHF